MDNVHLEDAVNQEDREYLQCAYDDAFRTPRGSRLRPGTHFTLIGVLNDLGHAVYSVDAAMHISRKLLGIGQASDSEYEELCRE